MSLLDEILGGMMRQSGPQSAPPGNAMLNIALQFIQNYPGGLAGLLQAFGRAGYGEQAQSWVSTGRNLPISPDVITQILGGQQVRSMGEEYGVEPHATAGGLASLLPEIINQMTPSGQVESDPQQDDLGALLEGVRARLTG
jgi:uncharacterized protein YidB (DUF937 family)